VSKRIIFVVALVAALTVTALAGAGLVFAQGPTPPVQGYAPGCGCSGWRSGSGRGWYGMGLIDILAELTGLESADLYAELQEGKTLLEIAQEDHDISAEQLVEAALASRAEVLKQRVEAGYLTQEQADWMLDHMEEEMLEHLEAGVSPGFNCWRFGGQPTPSAQSGMWGGQRGGSMWGGWRGSGRWTPGSTS
jgi:hypothetical protein